MVVVVLLQDLLQIFLAISLEIERFDQVVRGELSLLPCLQRASLGHIEALELIPHFEVVVLSLLFGDAWLPPDICRFYLEACEGLEFVGLLCAAVEAAQVVVHVKRDEGRPLEAFADHIVSEYFDRCVAVLAYDESLA